MLSDSTRYARHALILLVLAAILFLAALVVALGWHSGNTAALLAGGLLCLTFSRLFA
jgi:hypothetical protein